MVASAAGLLSLLDEQDEQLQQHALSKIDLNLNSIWSQVADGLLKIEALSESPTFPARQLASLVAAKVYYHLSNLDDALAFALGAGELFDVGLTGEGASRDRQFVDTVVSKAIDTYIGQRSTSSTVAPDARLTAIVESMFARCERDGENKQALGIALSSHRLDVVERVFKLTKEKDLLDWILQITVREGVLATEGRSYREEVLRLLIKLYSALETPDYFSITQCFVYLNDASLASNLLASLLDLPAPPSSSAAAASAAVIPTPQSGEENTLIAYQIAFDLAETATQEFLEIVKTQLRAEAAAPEGDEEEKAGKRDKVIEILAGEETIKLYLEFLFKSNKSDLLILKGTKEALESRNSIYHNAVTFMNAFAHAGTTSDQFLRENLDWLARASNWSKFSATAALGVIHKGNLLRGLEVLQPYLPAAAGAGAGGGAAASVYSEGGALFALGLVNANHASSEILNTLRECLKLGTQSEVLQHGASLGLGIAAMGTGTEEIYDELRDVLFNDSAIAGEAAGYSMGLVMLGTASERAKEEMMQYAHETQHEKIIRGLAVGIAFLYYGTEEGADEIIDTLLKDVDPILRYGGIQTMAMAYAGTGNNKIVRQLLHVAVSDVNDDVRRAAVTSLGFLLFRNPAQVPRIVQLLSESYNPHVRYGAALALGISCAGTGLEDAIALLEPLTKDPVDFVRQGACISLAMVLIQQNEASNPKVAAVRAIYTKIIGDKHEDAMAKFGAAISQGIIDAGGRNVTITMQNKSGMNNMPAIVGMALFTQFWYWFPMANGLALAFTPTAIIGLDKDLKMPKFDFVSKARPSLFAYPPATKVAEDKAPEKVATAVLSTTAKATQRAKNKAKEAAAAEGMDTDEAPTGDKDAEMKDDAAAPTAEEDAEKTGDEDGGEKKDAVAAAKKKKEKEPSFETLSNLSRVTPAQLAFITFPPESRYTPVRPVVASFSKLPSSSVASVLSGTAPKKAAAAAAPTIGAGGGILIMRDATPDEPSEFIELEVSKAPPPADIAAGVVGAAAAGSAEAAGGDARWLEGPIADPPEPFEFTDWE